VHYTKHININLHAHDTTAPTERHLGGKFKLILCCNAIGIRTIDFPFFHCGADAHLGPRPPHCCGFL